MTAAGQPKLAAEALTIEMVADDTRKATDGQPAPRPRPEPRAGSFETLIAMFGNPDGFQL